MPVTSFTVPIRLYSEANGSHGSWRRRHEVTRMQKAAVAWAWRETYGHLRPELPVAVTLVRVAPRPLDAHDNLRVSAKHAVDSLAACLGVDDRDSRVEWRYGQRRGRPREYALEVTIEPLK